MVLVVFSGALVDEDGSDAFDALVLVTGVLIALLGWVRLYWYTTRGHRQEHFMGLPTPAMAFLAIMVSHILNPDRWGDYVEDVAPVATAILLISTLLMVVPVGYPKVRGKVALALAAIVVASLAFIGTMRSLEVPGTDDIFRLLAVGALGLVSGYVLLGPVYVALRGSTIE